MPIHSKAVSISSWLKRKRKEKEREKKGEGEEEKKEQRGGGGEEEEKIGRKKNKIKALNNFHFSQCSFVCFASLHDTILDPIGRKRQSDLHMSEKIS